MNEIWKNINDTYMVSNLGNVKSVKRIVNMWNGQKTRPETLISQQVSHKGYNRVFLFIEGKNKVFTVHRLVAEAFIPNSENKLQINHKNGIKTDNRVENLEWCTNSENEKHAVSTGLRPESIAAKLTEKQVREIKILLKTKGCKSIANMYNVSKTTILYIKQGKTWKHIKD